MARHLREPGSNVLAVTGTRTTRVRLLGDLPGDTSGTSSRQLSWLSRGVETLRLDLPVPQESFNPDAMESATGLGLRIGIQPVRIGTQLTLSDA